MRNTSWNYAIGITMLIVVLIPTLSFSQSGEILKGVECGPLHPVGNYIGYGLIGTEHLTFRTHDYFYGTLEDGFFDYDRSKFGQKRLCNAGGNYDDGVYEQCLINHGLKTILYPHLATVNNESFDLSLFAHIDDLNVWEHIQRVGVTLYEKPSGTGASEDVLPIQTESKSVREP